MKTVRPFSPSFSMCYSRHSRRRMKTVVEGMRSEELEFLSYFVSWIVLTMSLLVTRMTYQTTRDDSIGREEILCAGLTNF